VPPSQREELAREVPKLDVLEPIFHPIHLFAHPRYVPRVAWLRAARRVPYAAGKWDSRAVAAGLRRELLGRPFDTVWLEGLGSVHYLPLIRRLQPGARVVLGQQNVVSDIWAKFASRQHGVKRLLVEAERRAVLRFEREALRAVDAVSAISVADADAYRALAAIEAVTVPQVVPFIRRATPPSTAPRFCYVGTVTWHPNAQGLDWFFARVWPIVRERLPDATLELAGPGLPTDARGVAVLPPAWRAPGVTALGFVPDLEPLYERSAAMVAPIVGGSGVRMKLLDAFAHGVPVVTNPDGAAGLPIEPGCEAFVEADPRAFAERLAELTTSREQQSRLREAGYRFLARHHGLETGQAAMRVLLGLHTPTQSASASTQPLLSSAVEMDPRASVQVGAYAAARSPR
jgi:glycosyltransferase involved in cell wall biosynthesis